MAGAPRGIHHRPPRAPHWTAGAPCYRTSCGRSYVERCGPCRSGVGTRSSSCLHRPGLQPISKSALEEPLGTVGRFPRRLFLPGSEGQAVGKFAGAKSVHDEPCSVAPPRDQYSNWLVATGGTRSRWHSSLSKNRALDVPNGRLEVRGNPAPEAMRVHGDWVPSCMGSDGEGDAADSGGDAGVAGGAGDGERRCSGIRGPGPQ